MWGYYWGFTSQEIALMAIDQPIVVYDTKDDKKKGKFKKAKALDVIKAENEWKAKYEGKENKNVKLDLGGFGLKEKATE